MTDFNDDYRDWDYGGYDETERERDERENPIINEAGDVPTDDLPDNE